MNNEPMTKQNREPAMKITHEAHYTITCVARKTHAMNRKHD